MIKHLAEGNLGFEVLVDFNGISTLLSFAPPIFSIPILTSSSKVYPCSLENLFIFTFSSLLTRIYNMSFMSVSFQRIFIGCDYNILWNQHIYGIRKKNNSEIYIPKSFFLDFYMLFFKSSYCHLLDVIIFCIRSSITSGCYRDIKIVSIFIKGIVPDMSDAFWYCNLFHPITIF